MHELKLVADLLRNVLEVAENNQARKINKVRIKIGESCHARAENIDFLFRQAAKGTMAEKAELEVIIVPGEDLILDSLQVD